MTNLMQQLQQWADEGLYDWDNPTLDEGLKWMQMGSSDIRDFQPFEAFRFVDSWEPFVQCVLDGTIQVWRPVDKYDPIFDAELYLCLGKDGEQYIGNITYFEESKGATRLYCVVVHHDDFDDHKTYPEITHWQPLPSSELVARLKGGE